MGDILSQNTLTSPTTPACWHVLGAGAIGRLWAAKLLEAQCAVSLIQRKLVDSSHNFIHYADSLDAKNTQTYPVENTHPQALLRYPQSVSNLIIATKSFDAVDALKSVAPILSKNANVLVLCNGLGIQTALATILAKHGNNAKLYWGVSSDGALLDKDNKLTHTGHGTTHIGLIRASIQNAQQHWQPLKLPKQLKLDIQHVKKVRPLIWHKFFINCAINPSTVFFDCKNGALITQPKPHDFFQQLCAELQSVYDSLLLDEKIKREEKLLSDFNLYLAAKYVATQTSENTSSMLQDIRRAKRTEISALNGHLLTLASHRGMPCPLNRQLVEHIQSLSGNVNN